MSDEQKQVAKKARLDMENSAAGPSQIQHAAAGPLTSSILKLDVDCFEELFEWLSLADLRALRQTCKRLKQVVDYFIKTNYPAVKIGFGRIMLDEEDFNKFKELDVIKMKMIKEVHICVDEMTDEMIDTIKGTLPQLEKFIFLGFKLQSNIYESILKWCSNLKYWSIMSMNFSKESLDEDNNWHKYQLPMLEHLKIEYYKSFPANVDLATFLQLNPNIQTFSCDFEILELYYDRFLESNIKIDLLNVSVEDGDVFEDILDQLYGHGFHKRLHLFIDTIADQTQLDRMALIHGMEKLYLSPFIDTQHTLPPIPCLRELCIDHLSRLPNVDLTSVAKIFLNLERVYFWKGRTIDIIPFIRYAPKVKEIKVKDLEEGIHFENGIIDLSALNKERKELAGACKVVIYVKEHIFLSTKFATAKTEYSLVTLKRTEAVEWIHKFSSI